VHNVCAHGLPTKPKNLLLSFEKTCSLVDATLERQVGKLPNHAAIENITTHVKDQVLNSSNVKLGTWI
jgi:hypothetical protein